MPSKRLLQVEALAELQAALKKCEDAELSNSVGTIYHGGKRVVLIAIDGVNIVSAGDGYARLTPTEPPTRSQEER